jgi:NAD(P)-dependent dehydrogenase (short-subunit alcohol dehydrogenase family)
MRYREEYHVTKSPQELFDLTGRVAVVTGATKGLGRAMAEGLAAAGASVVVSSRRQDGCEQAAAEIAKTTGRTTMAAVLHVGDWDAAPAFVDAVYERFGRIDILVNNAGINPSLVEITDLTSALIDKVFAVNFKGPVRLASLIAPRMGKAGTGSIINVATAGAYTGGPNVSAYTASKAALINVTRTMAKEWARLGVRVNAISPGPFGSEMMRGGERTNPGFAERVASSTLLKRVADPSEIVGAVVYLASDASSFVTGEDHLVSGGLLRA